MQLARYFVLASAVALIALAGYSAFSTAGPLLFSPTELLAASWRSYKDAYIDASYRTIDPARGVTTSEGESYAMLRAAWMGDKPAFDGSWQWTKDNLARPADHLFAWLWATTTARSLPATGHVLSYTTASDADSDIALALIFAYARWQDPRYLAAARATIGDIWREEVVTIGGVPYLAADNVEKNSGSAAIVVNPSYLSPASYHLFAMVDPDHPWESLRSASYDLLAKSAALPLDATTSDGLPPDWILVSRKTSAISADAAKNADTNFGYDALRVPWRIALDYAWFKNPAAPALLARFSHLTDEWRANERLPAIQAHDGSVVDGSESAALYGGAIGYFLLADQKDASAVFRAKLLSLYDPATGAWTTDLSYYDANWVWFGIALYEGLLPNLAADLPKSAFGG